MWPRDDVASEAGLRKLEKSYGVASRVPRALPFAVAKPLLAVCWLTNRCKSLLIDSKSFRIASRCFSLLPAAFPLRLGWTTVNLYVWTPGPNGPACLLAC